MRTRLTDRQKVILGFIIAHIEEQGYAPTLRVIMAEFGIGSLEGAAQHLKALERKGYIAHRGEKRTNYFVVRNIEGQRVALRFVPIEE